MKCIKLFLALFVWGVFLCGISSCSKEDNNKPDIEQPTPDPEPEPDPDPTPDPNPAPDPHPDDYEFQ